MRCYEVQKLRVVRFFSLRVWVGGWGAILIVAVYGTAFQTFYFETHNFTTLSLTQGFFASPRISNSVDNNFPFPYPEIMGNHL